MNKEELEKFKSSVDIKEFKNFILENRDNVVISHYGLSYGNLKQLKKEFNIRLSNSELQKRRREGFQKVRNEKENNLLQSISKEDLISFYITEKIVNVPNISISLVDYK